MGDQIRVVRGWDKIKGIEWTDYPDCPDPYRTLLREASMELFRLEKELQQKQPEEDSHG